MFGLFDQWLFSTCESPPRGEGHNPMHLNAAVMDKCFGHDRVVLCKFERIGEAQEGPSAKQRAAHCSPTGTPYLWKK